MGQDERAVNEAAPILRGALACGEIPHRTLARLVLPLLRLGRVEEAARHHLRGYRLIARNHHFLNHVSNHLAFLVLTDNFSRAARLFEKHLPWAQEAMALLWSFEFYLSGRLLLHRLQELGKSSLRLRQGPTFPIYQETGRYETAALTAWLDRELEGLAARFDARNGNDCFCRRIAENLQLRDFARPCPLDPEPPR